MIRLIALYLYYRDLQEERAQAATAPAPAKAPAPIRAANEGYARHWAAELAA